jgi:hypothetical protein
MVMPLLGAHMSIAGGYYKAVEHAHTCGCDVVQLFTKTFHDHSGETSGTLDLDLPFGPPLEEQFQRGSGPSAAIIFVIPSENIGPVNFTVGHYRERK